MKVPRAATVSAYIAAAPPVARRALKQMRVAIKKAAPGMTERISYAIPMLELDGERVAYIAAFTKHVGMYPVTAGMIAKHGKALAPYRAGKATLRFPLDKPIPLALIGKLAKARVRELRAGAR